MIMADMAGSEVLERPKSEAETRDIPVIINSSANLAEEERLRIAHGTTAILSKSMGTAEQAYEKIRSALTRAGLGLTPAGMES